MYDLLNELIHRDVFRNELSGVIMKVSDDALDLSVITNGGEFLCEMVDVLSCGMIRATETDHSDGRVRITFKYDRVSL